jgi:hypothetical protein
MSILKKESNLVASTRMRSNGSMSDFYFEIPPNTNHDEADFQLIKKRKENDT